MRVIGDREWDMLLGVWNLRYLITEQIHQAWFSERTLHACRTRLSRLGNAGLIKSTPMVHPTRRWAWRLGTAGLAALVEKLGTDLKPYQDLTPQFIPHLVETNDVFLGLTTPGWKWESLPFEWLGSHRCGLRYVQSGRDPETGEMGRRNKLLRPDAILAVKGGTGEEAGNRRVFVELDRGTESIVSATGRTSIVAKLKAYRAFCTARAPDSRTWYEREFGDRRPYAVAFVVPASSRQSQRKTSILEAVRTKEPSMRGAVHCLVANDLDGLRGLCGLPEPRPAATEMPVCNLTAAEAASIRHLYDVSVDAYRRLRPESSVRPRFKEAARAARQVLERLQATGGG